MHSDVTCAVYSAQEVVRNVSEHFLVCSDGLVLAVNRLIYIRFEVYVGLDVLRCLCSGLIRESLLRRSERPPETKEAVDVKYNMRFDRLGLLLV